MRAFMSDANARAAWERERILHGWPGDDERATEREARAILAETEPSNTVTERRTIYRPLRAINPSVRRALADALAAFVADGEGR